MPPEIRAILVGQPAESKSRGYVYRNSLYMTLTRSFLQSRMIVSGELNKELLPRISDGLSRVNAEGKIEVMPPSDAEKAQIKTTITVAASTLSFFDMAEKAFEEIGVPPLWRESLIEALKKVIGEEPDMENILETSRFMYDRMLRSRA